MIRRTSCRAESFHLLNKKSLKFIRSQKRFSLLIKISFIGRTATFGNEEELILITVYCINIKLRRHIVPGVLLLIHIKCKGLRISEIIGSVRIIYSVR